MPHIEGGFILIGGYLSTSYKSLDEQGTIFGVTHLSPLTSAFGSGFKVTNKNKMDIHQYNKEADDIDEIQAEERKNKIELRSQNCNEVTETNCRYKNQRGFCKHKKNLEGDKSVMKCCPNGCPYKTNRKQPHLFVDDVNPIKDTFSINKASLEGKE